MSSKESIFLTVSDEFEGQRLDLTLSKLLPDISRSSIVQLIRRNNVKVEHADVKPSYRIKGGEQVEVVVLPNPEIHLPKAEPLQLSILYEDSDILVVNKEPGMVVHPAPGNYSHTLVNALLYRNPPINEIGKTERPGIVHRLDKGTSGVMIVAKSQIALTGLAIQFQERSLKKKYLALVWGIPTQNEGEVNYSIGRHPTNRKKMSINSRRGRDATSLWKIKERYSVISLLEVGIKTGRTHQIRVHCAAMHHPVVGDPLYGARQNFHLGKDLPGEVKKIIANLQHQMLHAWQIKIIHPRTKEEMCFMAPMPQNMELLINALREAS